jgi:shikimate kinase
MVNAQTIVLIGPICAGKSTVSQLLAQSLSIPYFSVDDHRWDYYKEIGYDEEEASRIAKSGQGILGVLHYWKPFEAHAVERVLASQSNCVIDFGAGHSVYDDPVLFERVQRALTPFPHVILLLPSPDDDESVTVLNVRFAELLQRETGTVNPELLQLNKAFVKHPANRTLAKMIVYTNEKTPDEVTGEIVERLKRHLEG